jgi:hypothetical protein
VGRYNAVLLTSAALLQQHSDGTFVSALDGIEWSTLWEFERRFRVRQVALNAAPSTDPEDYCLRLRHEGPIGGSPAPVWLSGAGAHVFDYLDPHQPLPLADSYAYRSSVEPDCMAQPLLTTGSDVLGVISTSPDGRERLALTFTLGAVQPLEELLGFGLLRWATRGVFLGEQRHWLSVDVDDWFNRNNHGLPGGPVDAFRLTAGEAVAVKQAQDTVRKQHPLVGDFALNLAYNGGGILSTGSTACADTGGADPLTNTTRCLADEFRWVNHTMTHRIMDSLTYDESYREIKDNLSAGAAVGLAVPPEVLKTPEYSGLGVSAAGDPRAPDRDLGLAASNPAMLKAASDLGIRYLHGNMSYPSHRPDCFNCGVHHPLQPDLLLVPDWPTNIYWQATTPEEETAWYATLYGQGQVAAGSTVAHRYADVIDVEADEAMRHIMRGSVYSHTLHQTNLHEYAPARSLTFDWLGVVLARYSARYTVPLKNPDWSTLAAYVNARTAHFAALAHGPDAIWNRVTNEVTYLPVADTSLFVTGLALRPATEADQHRSDEAEHYGSDSVSRLGLTVGQPVSLMASPRS